jgi:hypothetical protein
VQAGTHANFNRRFFRPENNRPCNESAALVLQTSTTNAQSSHSGRLAWVPACAGMTDSVGGLAAS